MTHKAAAHPTTQSAADKDQLSLGAIAMDLLDTAWRIAVPVIVLAAAGIAVDNLIGSGPGFTLAGSIAGFVIAGYLVKRQLQAAEFQETHINNKDKDK